MAGSDVALMAHLMLRAGFGASYEELERRNALGYRATVEELLHPEEQPDLQMDVMQDITADLATIFSDVRADFESEFSSVTDPSESDKE